MQRIVAIILCFAIVLICGSCSSDVSEQKDSPSYLVGLHKNDTILLKKECHLIICPGGNYLMPTNSDATSDYEQKYGVAGIVPAETKVKFLGAYKSNTPMTDSVMPSDYGRILDGKFQGKKVSIEDLIADQLQKPIYFQNLAK